MRGGQDRTAEVEPRAYGQFNLVNFLGILSSVEISEKEELSLSEDDYFTSFSLVKPKNSREFIIKIDTRISPVVVIKDDFKGDLEQLLCLQRYVAEVMPYSLGWQQRHLLWNSQELDEIDIEKQLLTTWSNEDISRVIGRLPPNQFNIKYLASKDRSRYSKKEKESADSEVKPEQQGNKEAA